MFRVSKGLHGRRNLKTVEVHCETAREVLCERLKQRDLSGERHLGHETIRDLKKINCYLDDGAYGPLGIGEALVRVDTTDLERVKYDEVVSAVKIEVGL